MQRIALHYIFAAQLLLLMTNVKAFFFRNNLPELVFYLLCWAFVLVVPIFLEAYYSAFDSEIGFQWAHIGYSYLGYLPFMICFLVAKFMLEPRLYYAGHYRSFVVSTILVALLVTLGVRTVASKPGMRRHELYRQEQTMIGSQSPADCAQTPNDRRSNRGRRHKPLMRSPFWPMFFMNLLVMTASLGVSVAFRYRRDQLDLKEKQAARLQSELDYLKYQINPHFFMNTLNNIHALVDIDGNLAKEAIIELSRMMRYLLYESNYSTVPLQKELDFVQHYLELMRLRCDDSVSIRYESAVEPDIALQLCIPPMLLISFVENAFKHGISYRDPSYIHILIRCDGNRQFHFHCRNSNFSNESNRQQQGGVGLDNVRKRLELLYPGRYTLQIVPAQSDFTVDLRLPL